MAISPGKARADVDERRLAAVERDIDEWLRTNWDGASVAVVPLDWRSIPHALREAVWERYREAGWRAVRFRTRDNGEATYIELVP